MTPDELKRAIAYNDTQVIPSDELAVLVQGWQVRSELAGDGKYGPLTRASVRQQLQGSVKRWPSNRAETIAFYGNPSAMPRSMGNAKLAWQRANIVECHGPTRLPGAPVDLYVQVHRKFEPVLRAAMKIAQVVCPSFHITRIGGFVYRAKSSNPEELSLHAFGAAVDIDAEFNRAVRFKPGEKPIPFSDTWLELWPDGLPKDFVDAMRGSGLVWGGDFSTYVDPMHFQGGGPAA